MFFDRSIIGPKLWCLVSLGALGNWVNGIMVELALRWLKKYMRAVQVSKWNKTATWIASIFANINVAIVSLHGVQATFNPLDSRM